MGKDRQTDIWIERLLDQSGPRANSVKSLKVKFHTRTMSKKLNMTPGSGKDKSFKCDYCSEINPTRQALHNHIVNTHKK